MRVERWPRADPLWILILLLGIGFTLHHLDGRAHCGVVHTHTDLADSARIYHNDRLVHIGADGGYYDSGPDSAGAEGFAHLAQFRIPDSVDVVIPYSGSCYLVIREHHPQGWPVFSRWFQWAPDTVRVPQPAAPSYLHLQGFTGPSSHYWERLEPPGGWDD